MLDWSSENETNTSHFIIEKSSDGDSFTQAGNVAANGTGRQQCQFTTTMMAGIYFIITENGVKKIVKQ